MTDHARDMTPEERAEMERSTLEAHDAFDKLLRNYRVTPSKEHTHWLIAYNPEGEAVAFALDENDERTAEAALRWLREGRSVNLVTADEGRRLFDIAIKR